MSSMWQDFETKFDDALLRVNSSLTLLEQQTTFEYCTEVMSQLKQAQEQMRDSSGPLDHLVQRSRVSLCCSQQLQSH
jgi:hypothetical protein